MAVKINLNGQKLNAALDKFMEVGFWQRRNRLEETVKENRKLMPVGMNFIAPMPLLVFLMICRSRRQ